MEILLVLVALFVLIAFPVAVLVHLAAIRESIDRLAESVHHAESAALKLHAESAEVAKTKPHAESAEGSEAKPNARFAEVAKTKLRAESAEGSEAKPNARFAEVAKTKPRAESAEVAKRAVVPPPLPSASAEPHVLRLAAADEPPPEPTKFEQWTAAAWEWLRVGEAWRPDWIPGPFAVAAVQLLRAAALLLLFGAAWFVRYVHEQGWLSPALRVAAGFAVATALVACGSTLLRRRYRPVGLAVVGLGFALGEFMDWAGANLYGVLPAGAAFGIAAALALGAGLFAWRHASLLLALVALFAGYTAPLFFREADGGDAAGLAWLLVLAGEGAALAVTRGWRSLPWLCGAAGFALATPILSSDVRLAALGRGAALAFLGLHAALCWAQSAGRALLRRRAPLAPDAAAWLAATAATAVAASLVAQPWPEPVRGLPCLALAAGSAALAAAFVRRGVRGRTLLEGLGGAGGALLLAFLAQSFSGSALCALAAVAAFRAVAAAARWRSAVAAVLALGAWCVWLGAVGKPATGFERLARFGSGVLSLWASGLLLLRWKPCGGRAFAPGFLWCAWGATLAWASWEMRRAFPDAAPALALLWSAIALATLAAGLRFARRDVRGAALALFALAAGKFLLVDQAGAPTPERVAGFLGVGLLLLLGSAVYIRSATREKKQ